MTLGSVTLVRVKSARVTAIWIGNHEIAAFDDIVYEYDKKHSQQLVYVALSRVILIRYLIYVFVDHDTYYKCYLKKLKKQ